MPRGSHMTARYGDKNGSFTAQLEQFQLEALAAIEQTFKDVVIQIGETIINITPVDTGRAKGSWVLTIGAPSTVSPERYDKEGTETIAALVAEANKLEPGQVAWIVSALPYSIPLEYGHSQKAPSGMIRVTVAKFQQIVREAVLRNQV